MVYAAAVLLAFGVVLLLIQPMSVGI